MHVGSDFLIDVQPTYYPRQRRESMYVTHVPFPTRMLADVRHQLNSLRDAQE
jgi:hypothetical protein